MSAARGFDLIIIGGGISGLTAAYEVMRLTAEKPRILLLEAENRLGGTIQTEHTADCILDGGPDSFLAAKPEGKALVEELGLGGDLIVPRPDFSRAYLLRDDRLRLMPKGMVLGVPRKPHSFLFSAALPFAAKLRMAKDLLHPKTTPTKDESVAAFMGRHFGNDAVALLAEPLLGGIYAGRASELSIQATFPQLVQLENQHGSLIRGFRALQKSQSHNKKAPLFYSLRQGMGQIIAELQRRLPTEILQQHAMVQKVTRGSAKVGYRVTTKDGQIFEAPVVFIATPAPAARQLLDDPRIVECLDPFASVSTATVFLGFRRRHLSFVPHGLGFIVPRHERSPLLAGTFIAEKFAGRAPDEIFLTRFFFGGVGREEFAEKDDADLVALAREEARRILKIPEQPLFSRVFHWRKTSPQYRVGHLENLANLDRALTDFPGLHLLGSNYRGVGFSDCVREAKKTATNFVEQLAKSRLNMPE